MKTLAAALTLAVAPVTAMAQGLPMFEEALGYEILDVFDDGLIVMNAGQGFYCEIDEGPGDRYLVMTGCLPILAPGQAADLARAAAAGAGSEEAFFEALENMPVAAFVPAVSAAMRETGCKLDFGGGEDSFVALVARRVAENAGYDGALTEDLVDEIGEITEDTADLMIENGQIVVDRDTGIARLAACP